MPNPPRPDDPRFFQSNSQTFNLPLDSDLTFLRVFGEGTNGQVFVRAAKEGGGDEGVKVDVRGTWRDRVDWEDDKWGTEMLRGRIGGGDAGLEGRGKRGVLLEVSLETRRCFRSISSFTPSQPLNFLQDREFESSSENNRVTSSTAYPLCSCFKGQTRDPTSTNFQPSSFGR